MSTKVIPAVGEMVDGSGTITSGGTSQALFPANASRKYLFVQNHSAGALYINFAIDAVVTQPSIMIAASGGTFVMDGPAVSRQAVNIIGATTAQAFTAKELV